MKKTEKQLGVPIFDRKAKPLCLTEYGVRYISYLEKIQDLENEMEQYLNDKLSPESHAKVEYIRGRPIHYDTKR